MVHGSANDEFFTGDLQHWININLSNGAGWNMDFALKDLLAYDMPLFVVVEK